MMMTRMALAGAAAMALVVGGSARADLAEGFDDINTLVPGGWYMQNNSQPLGVTDWFQGNLSVFPGQSGGYIGANYNNTGDPDGTISNWLLTPEVALANGNTVSFYTRCPDGSIWPDRLQVRMSTAGSSTNVGTGAEDVGDFDVLLLDINPNEQQFVYPEVWTQFTVTLSGLIGGETGRIAIRYYVHNGGPSGANSNYIGVDTFLYQEGGGVPRMFLDGPDYSPWQPVTDPTPFPWHELWPVFCESWDCTGWTDNGNGILDECDFMQFADGSTWHVATVTVTVIIEEVEGGPVEDYIYLEWESPPFTTPVGVWHEVYPTFCNLWDCVDWIDNGNGVLDNCDWMIMDTGAGQVFMHVVGAATDIEIFEEGGPNPCPEDVNGDGTVNVLDLLAVLAAWDNPGGPEDINGDGVVNVLDLLAVLAAWGPCP